MKIGHIILKVFEENFQKEVFANEEQTENADVQNESYFCLIRKRNVFRKKTVKKTLKRQHISFIFKG